MSQDQVDPEIAKALASLKMPHELPSEEREARTIRLSETEFAKMIELIENPDPTPSPAMQELLRSKPPWEPK